VARSAWLFRPVLPEFDRRGFFGSRSSACSTPVEHVAFCEAPFRGNIMPTLPACLPSSAGAKAWKSRFLPCFGPLQRSGSREHTHASHHNPKRQPGIKYADITTRSVSQGSRARISQPEASARDQVRGYHNPKRQRGIKGTEQPATKPSIPQDTGKSSLPSVRTRERGPASMRPCRVDPSLTLRVTQKYRKNATFDP
jgi:hypothetical protein